MSQSSLDQKAKVGETVRLVPSSNGIGYSYSVSGGQFAYGFTRPGSREWWSALIVMADLDVIGLQRLSEAIDRKNGGVLAKRHAMLKGKRDRVPTAKEQY